LTTDPFPSISPALLNSADIEDYVRTTGLIYPFDLAKLKPASYEADFLGEVYYWKNTESAPTIVKIEKGQKFTISKNSIVFVHLATVFSLPSYIALRFNLRITLVHRGLLLGTGPLVDPGFCGRLLIPLHNLTSEDCTLVGGAGFIWIEFTKLSGNKEWGSDCADRSGDPEVRKGTYKKFPSDKKGILPEKYLSQASPHAAIASSIPDALDEARRLSRASENLFRQIRRWGSLAAAIGALTIAVGMGTLLYQGYSLVSDANNYVNTLRKDMDVKERRFDQQAAETLQQRENLKKLEIEFDTIKRERLKTLEHDVESIKERLVKKQPGGATAVPQR
jgi:deoxycytidine triphosphate deaminase